DGGIAKNRTRLLTEIFANIARMNNERWEGWQGEILIDEKGKDDTWVGRNAYYKPVIVRGDVKQGDFVKVRIGNVTSYDLRGDIIY
ncbi:MAG TPA: TRAM domain-containing protein, partial [Candidatus Nanoarchaeia archaeon]|nr:TRAM domain-containing protein [Candidatus Nanoarchaeia archaeon]